jgi:hypothetical protein
MKFRINLSMALLLSIAFATSLSLSSCKEDDDKKCCEGYTGAITEARADSLVKRCHFIKQDTIKDWVSRYEAYKKTLDYRKEYKMQADTTQNQAPAMPPLSAASVEFLKNGCVSFNNCIVKKILCDKNSIGLRVLYGIDTNNKIHIILVGIKPDYTDLYVDGDECCNKSMNQKLGAGLTSITDNKGGAEYGQLP